MAIPAIDFVAIVNADANKNTINAMELPMQYADHKAKRSSSVGIFPLGANFIFA